VQESLGGNSRTSLIVNISPAMSNRAETITTLRFGIRAKRMVNKPRVNKERSPAELKALLLAAEAEIAKLKHRVKILESECHPPPLLCGLTPTFMTQQS
jgi:kinesin family protein 5